MLTWQWWEKFKQNGWSLCMTTKGVCEGRNSQSNLKSWWYCSNSNIAPIDNIEQQYSYGKNNVDAMSVMVNTNSSVQVTAKGANRVICHISYSKANLSSMWTTSRRYYWIISYIMEQIHQVFEIPVSRTKCLLLKHCTHWCRRHQSAWGQVESHCSCSDTWKCAGFAFFPWAH